MSHQLQQTDVLFYELCLSTLGTSRFPVVRRTSLLQVSSSLHEETPRAVGEENLPVPPAQCFLFASARRHFKLLDVSRFGGKLLCPVCMKGTKCTNIFQEDGPSNQRMYEEVSQNYFICNLNIWERVRAYIQDLSSNDANLTNSNISVWHLESDGTKESLS